VFACSTQFIDWMQPPIEVLEKIFCNCEISDIQKWRDIVPPIVYLCKVGRSCSKWEFVRYQIPRTTGFESS
jgi:hypothetical protein